MCGGWDVHDGDARGGMPALDPGEHVRGGADQAPVLGWGASAWGMPRVVGVVRRAVFVRHLADDVESHRLSRTDEDGEEALVEVVRRDLVALVPQEVVERGDELGFRSTGVLLVRARRVSHAAFALRLDELHGEGVVSGPASGGRGGEESARRVRPVEGRLSSVHRADGRWGGCCAHLDLLYSRWMSPPADLRRRLDGVSRWKDSKSPSWRPLPALPGVDVFLRGGMALRAMLLPRGEISFFKSGKEPRPASPLPAGSVAI